MLRCVDRFLTGTPHGRSHLQELATLRTPWLCGLGVFMCSALSGCQSKLAAGEGAEAAGSGAAGGASSSSNGSSADDSNATSVGSSTSGSRPGPAACNPNAQPPTAPLRRLTAAQYQGAVVSLFGDAIDADVGFPSTPNTHRFTSYADANVVSEAAAEAIWQAAQAIAAQVAADPESFIDCDVSPPSQACFEAFMADVAERAFRRPLMVSEQDTLSALVDEDAEASLSERAESFVMTILMSPQFLYLDEGRVGAPMAGGTLELPAHALAERLAFFLWQSLPDAELRRTARDDSLLEPEVLEAQTVRLLDDPRSEGSVIGFHSEWLGLGKLAGLRKDPEYYPEFDAELSASLATETERFVREVVFERDGGIEQLLTATVAFSNIRTDDIFGISSGSSGPDDFVRVDLPAERAGILTRPAFLSMQAYDKSSAPVRRGAFVLKQLLCQEMTIPNNVNTEGIDAPSSASNTVRDRLAAHRSQPACAACHTSIDPIGFAFEHFDAIGRWRDEWAPQTPVDASGTLEEPSGSFDGVQELVQLLLTDPQLEQCYATQWFRYASARESVDADTCAIQSIVEQAASAGGGTKQLLVALVQSPAFRTRVAEPVGEEP